MNASVSTLTTKECQTHGTCWMSHTSAKGVGHEQHGRAQCKKSCNLVANLIVNSMVALHEEGGSGEHAKFTGLPCFTLLRRNSGDNRFHQK